MPAVFNKKLLKTFVVALLKTLNESDPAVRDASAEALGTLLKLLGEKTVGPLFADVDPLKMVKVKECAEKAVIVVKVPSVAKTRPATAPSGKPSTVKDKEVTKPVTRPATGIGKKQVLVKKQPSSGGGGGAGGGNASARVVKSASSTKICTAERELTPEEVDERAADLLPGNIIAELGDANWKSRLSASETFLSSVSGLETSPQISQILIRIVCKKPGLKVSLSTSSLCFCINISHNVSQENNFQVLKLKLEIIKKIVEVFGISTTTGDMIINEVVEKLGDAKNSAIAAESLLAIADAINLEYVIVKMLGYSLEQKSPKVQIEALQLTGEAIQAFGLQVRHLTRRSTPKKKILKISFQIRRYNRKN